MFERVTVRASDHSASETFYATVLQTLGIERSGEGSWMAFRAVRSDRPGVGELDPDGNRVELMNPG
jgi:hypothetical protein